MRWRDRTFTVAAVFALTGHCSAHETILFRVPRAITPADPAVQIEMWARFSAVDYAFAGAFYGLEAEAGAFSHTGCEPLSGPCGSPPPMHDGRFVYGIVVGQGHFPPVLYAEPSNPILVAFTTWRPDSFEPHDVFVTTRTGEFRVFPEMEFEHSRSAMSTFTEGSAIIRVRRCYADCDGSDDLDFLDFLCFQDAFATDDYYADCDGSGELDFFDFLCYQNEFVLGCE